ncbi:MAG TPA: type 2 isopentenyl-diphosphate Delta-isomerase [Thermoanaerobaculia bacterium]|nr:type 2 isopentenyl-diphosphate Delta-isomerase [Thermoanaerobaculia bacterium]
MSSAEATSTFPVAPTAAASDTLDTPDNAGELAGRDRKAEHIRLALEPRMQLGTHYFAEYEFEHRALPEIDFAEIDTSVEFLGKRLASPLLISCMTGGTDRAVSINRNLAAGAEACGVAVGVGSQRKALEDPAKADTFRVRDVAPTVPLLANLGAVQLNYGIGLAECRQAVAMIEADALVFHANPLQEALQPEGQCNFKGLLPKMGAIARDLAVPVIVKEVGSGLSGAMGRALLDQGIRIVDTAGVGGTSWARIEAARAGTAGDLALGELFAGWGVPTPQSIRELAAIGGLTVIGSGGVRTGLDVAKALALGADLAGLAYQFLEAATESPERVVERIERIVHELKICMFCIGVRTVPELRQTALHRRPKT